MGNTASHPKTRVHGAARRRVNARTREASPPLLRLATLSSQRRKSLFARIADRAAHTAGSPRGFILAVTVVIVWAVTGPVFGFSDTWQLVINTGTTVVTFLMVFLVQATQNRDNAAFHLKLDEIVRSIKGASNELLDMEELTIEELDRFKADYEKLAEKARRR